MYLWICCESYVWQLLARFFVASNLGHNSVRCYGVVLTGHNYALFYVAFTHVFSADLFWPLHILFKYFSNISVADKAECKDIYIIIFFIVYLRWVSHNSSTITWRVIGVLYCSGRLYSPGEFNGLVNRSVLAFLFRTGCVPCPICCTFPQGSAWPDPGYRRTWHDLFLPQPYGFLPIVGSVGWGGVEVL